jgi:biotin operon repressor
VSYEADGRIVLSREEADCLLVLRNPGRSPSRIAIEAKLDLRRTDDALRKLAQLGLAEQTDSKLWLVTERGRTSGFDTAPDRPEARGRPPGHSAQRLLDLLDRPMRGAALAQELGLSRERVRQLLLTLHAEGRIVFGDPDRPFWLVKRADDESRILSRDEERVLSALPAERATNAGRLRAAAGLGQEDVEIVLGSLTAVGLAEAFDGLRGDLVYRVTAAGLGHPQYVPSGRSAPPPPLPVHSDRIRKVLQTIADAGALRIRDVKDRTRISQNSINALMQYLKRKKLVAKSGAEFDAPYALTGQGRAVLAEMTLRQAA